MISFPSFAPSSSFAIDPGALSIPANVLAVPEPPGADPLDELGDCLVVALGDVRRSEILA
jgi:hypothetical protein